MYTNQITCVPGDYYVALLRREGHEVHVFEKSNRRIVVIKLQCPYSKEAVYNSYDSELEKKKLFCPKILTQREVETLKEEYAKLKVSNPENDSKNPQFASL